MKIIFGMALVITLNATFAFAGQTSCPQFFVGGSAPEYLNQTRELCNTGYAVGHSGITRTPLWAAEHLTSDRLEAGRGLPRANNFRPDDRLPASERSELRDYSRSGYDRGHMVSAADSASPEEQSESFLLSNMIPQNPNNNRFLHEGIESVTRKEAKKAGELFVITGPIYEGADIKALKGRVLVPTGVFKCLYYPRKQQGSCYVENNAPGMDYNVASIAQVEQRTGVSLFPTVPQSVKNIAVSLPAPTPYNKGRR